MVFGQTSIFSNSTDFPAAKFPTCEIFPFLYHLPRTNDMIDCFSLQETRGNLNGYVLVWPKTSNKLFRHLVRYNCVHTKQLCTHKIKFIHDKGHIADGGNDRADFLVGHGK